ncbi:putative glycosyltransferase [Lactiplantibacillus paraplantarum]|uniref:glycosyltransferase n=1 Tax=Lactiplantibacillus paraplantarum TaxID=60520 RepID=UPI0003AD9FC8|nr:glycosyltransferase [Lactiplantibacillus paraplantarum]ERL43164.1 putative glycosyltransferase [Lactiplantibacillus paraplantarum]MCU4683190.1 glycosyltransferase [Lactiplantibacillus paraplantarum]MDL2062192.1 glycosyltransferase [Lactiplantibacillus paraplantarum]
MIFVTVGTHEQPFNRLLKAMDDYAAITNEKILIQSGYSTYVTKYAQSTDFITANDMKKNIRDARIVITHGGPSSFMEVLENKKIPIVVPRLKKYAEHVNNHQFTFAEEFNKEYKDIIIVNNLKTMPEVIGNYDKLASQRKDNLTEHNKQFNQQFEQMVGRLFV